MYIYVDSFNNIFVHDFYNKNETKQAQTPIIYDIY